MPASLLERAARYHGVRRHGLIMGCSVTGRKPAAGPSLPKLTLGPKAEPLTQVDTKFGVSKIIRLVLGTIGGKLLVRVCVCVCVCVCVPLR